jgi:hypothetical protein
MPLHLKRRNNEKAQQLQRKCERFDEKHPVYI